MWVPVHLQRLPVDRLAAPFALRRLLLDHLDPLGVAAHVWILLWMV
jgi:hypothetical protein